MASIKHDKAEADTNMDGDGRIWDRPGHDPVPDRLRLLAMRLQEALMESRSKDSPPVRQ